MPLIYRRPPRHRSPESTPVTDADDSIVLSDLVRSGEASRLRRRGAIAIRDSPLGPASQPMPLGFQTSLNPPQWDAPIEDRDTVPEPIRFMDETYDDEQNGDWEWTSLRRPAPVPDPNETSANNEWLERDVRRMALEAEVRVEDTDEDLPTHMLFCGGEISSDDEPDPLSFASLSSSSIIPAQAPRRRASAFCSAPPVRRSPPPRVRRINGCGALVHISALPRRRHSLWIARGAATESVIPMDSSYFDRRAVAKMMKSACGCVREGVGCRVCGNTLGTVYTPCQAAAEGLFPPSPSSTPGPPVPTQASAGATSRHPSGPSYWLPRSSQLPSHPHTPSSPPPQDANSTPYPNTPGPSSPIPYPPLPPTSTSSEQQRAPRVAIYTFFSSNVRPAPTFFFPQSSTPTIILTPLPTPPPPIRPPAQNSSQVLPPPQPLTPGGVFSSSTPRRQAYTTWMPPLQRSGVWGSEGALGSMQSVDTTDDIEDLEGESAEKPEGGGAGGSAGPAVMWADR